MLGSFGLCFRPEKAQIKYRSEFTLDVKDITYFVGT